MFKPNDEKDRSQMREGLALYRKGNIYNVTTDGTFVGGKVLDGTTYNTTLDLDDLEESHCDCNKGEFCVHQLGLFFYVYADVERVGVFLDDWKSSGVSLPQLGLGKNRKEYNEHSLQSWLEFFEKRYEEFKLARNQYDVYYSSAIFHRYFWALKNEAPKARELKGLFIIHAALTSFLKIAEKAPSSHSTVDSNIRPYMHQLIDVIADELMPLRSSILPFSMDYLVWESIERIREVLNSDDEFQYERISLYKTFWSATFPQKAFREVEKQKLTQEHTENYLLAQCHLAFLERDDLAAISLFEKLTPAPLHFCFDWMNTLMESNQLKRFEVWSKFSTANIKEYVHKLPDYGVKRNITRYFLQLMRDAGGSEQVYKDALKVLMPYSAFEYSHHLFDSKNYRGWVELQLLLHAEVNNFDRQKLKMIEDEDRACLLPLYHFSIRKVLHERNRQSYKQAVKYLKKLKTHYKKLKKLHQWEIYLSRLVAENKRLRAFMEELRKGKLIDA